MTRAVGVTRHGTARRTKLRIIAAAATLLASLSLASPAYAAPLPSDVKEQFQNKALREAAASAAEFGGQGSTDKSGPPAPDFSGSIKSGPVRQITFFSKGFLAGDKSAVPTETQQQWISSVQRGNEVLGTIRVWKPAGGPAELAQFSGDVELGKVLDAAKKDEVIEVGETSSFYTLSDGVVTPVNSVAKTEVPGPSKLSDVQAVMVARVDESRATVGLEHASVGGGGPVQAAETLADRRDLGLLVGGLVVAAAASGVMLILRHRHRRSSLRI